MRNIRSEIGECLLDISNERRAAGACEEALFYELCRFAERNHICTKSCFNNGVEAKTLDTGYDLTELRISELAGDRRSDNCVYLVFGILFALENHIDNVKNIGLIGDSAERALIYTSTAGDTLIVVDLCIFMFGMLCDRANLARTFARTLEVLDRAVRTNLRTHTAVYTLGFVNVCNVVFVKGDSTLLTYVFATVSKTAAANVSYLITTYRTFVASSGDNLDDIGVGTVAAHCELYAVVNDRSFLVYAATHGRFVTGNDNIGDIGYVFKKILGPCKTCNLTKNLIFQMLYFCIKLSHNRYTSFHLFFLFYFYIRNSLL